MTADDIGIHPGMTRGVIEAHRHGIVTSCSLVACGRDFDRASGLLCDEPRLAVGAHLTLVEESPVLPPSTIPSLVESNGRFHRSFRSFTLRWLAGRIRLQEVERELRAQVERIEAAGLTVTHLNGHQHLHVLPSIFDLVLRIARDQGIRYVRIPSDRSRGAEPLARRLQIAVLGRLGRAARSKATKAAVPTSDFTIGIAEAGHLGEESLGDLLAGLVGVGELVCHPGFGDREIAGEYAWGYEWDRERRALCEPGLGERLARAGIRLVTPAEIGAIERNARSEDR